MTDRVYTAAGSSPSTRAERPRVVVHLDMDAFFASVELLRYPDLRGRPVVVGGRSTQAPQTLPDGSRRYARLGDYVGRGVITTATYEARALGVHSAMGLMHAARLAPDAVLLPANFEAYRTMSRRFKHAVKGLAPVVEDRGIDEIYIDLTDHPEVCVGPAEAVLQRAALLGRKIQLAVSEATGLSCSLGITPNKLLSKLASDMQKPGGITVFDHAALPRLVWPLPAARINGIGPKAAERLRALNVNTIGELAAAPPEWLQRHFGVRYGTWLHRVAHGHDDAPVVVERERKSVSRETTFSRDLHARRDREELSRIFTDLCVRVAADLERLQLQGRTIGIKLRYDDFRTVTRDLTLEHPTAEAGVIRRAAGLCLKRVPLERPLRLLGVRVSSLGEPSKQSPISNNALETLPLFAQLLPAAATQTAEMEADSETKAASLSGKEAQLTPPP